MWASSLKRGYIVFADEDIVTIHDTLKEAEEHIHYQKTKMKSQKHWGIFHIKDCEWIELSKEL